MFPVLYSRSLLIAYFIYGNCVFVNPTLLTYPCLPFFPLLTVSLFLKFCFFRTGFFCPACMVFIILFSMSLIHSVSSKYTDSYIYIYVFFIFSYYSLLFLALFYFLCRLNFSPCSSILLLSLWSIFMIITLFIG